MNRYIAKNNISFNSVILLPNGQKIDIETKFEKGNVINAIPFNKNCFDVYSLFIPETGTVMFNVNDTYFDILYNFSETPC